MKKTIFLVLICLFSAKSFSQQFSLTGGTLLEMVDDLPFDGFGYYAGIATNIPIKNNWSFEPEIRFLNIEHNDNYGISKIHYLEIPIRLEHKTKLKNNNYFKYNFGGYFNVSLTGSDIQYLDTYQIYRNVSNMFGVGVLCGAGIEINKFYLGLEPNFRYYDVYGAGFSFNTKIAYRF